MNSNAVIIRRILMEITAIELAFYLWYLRIDSCNSEQLDEYIDLAKRIANLPEKED